MTPWSFSPTKKTTDNQLAPGKEYTIVSPDSGLKSGFSPTEDKDKIVVYVSSKQLILHSLKAEQDQEFIVIPHDAAKEMQTLANKIAALSKDETFNRKLITRKTLAQPGQGDSIMALPKSVESARPADVTGGVGVKPSRSHQARIDFQIELSPKKSPRLWLV